MKPAKSSSKSRSTSKPRQHGGTFEALESRQMMDATTFPIVANDDSNVITVQRVEPTLSQARAFKVGGIFRAGSFGGSQVKVTIDGVTTTYDIPLTQKIQLFAGAGDDKITVIGSRGVDVVAGPGNDWTIGGSGPDTFYGGLGYDTVDYSGRMTGVVVTADGRADDGNGSERDNVMGDNEVINGSQGNDYLANWNGANRIQLNGFAGNDKLFGGNNSDQLLGGPGNDYIEGMGGNDNCQGEAGHDTIHGGVGNDIVSGGAGYDVLYADSGADGVYGGDDDDKLFSGVNNDYLDGGRGNDVLVSVGGGQGDQLVGGPGWDNFWCDSESTETVKAEVSIGINEVPNVHKIASFHTLKVRNTVVTTPSRELDGPNLPEPYTGTDYPMTTGVQNFRYVPLFTSGGAYQNDIWQNQVGDCYFLATISAIAKTAPRVIHRSVVDLGDGTYCVQLKDDNGVKRFVRVDADLPMVGNTQLGTQLKGGALWAAIMEKAYAFVRGGSFGSYYAIGNGGQPSEAFYALGVNWSKVDKSTQAKLVTDLTTALNQGKILTVSTFPSSPNLVERHVYMVDSYKTVNGVTSFTLRNPWGDETNDPARDNINNGYVTVTADKLFASIKDFTFGTKPIG
jgi:Ca2+-binding RTX toxin-like protein